MNGKIVAGVLAPHPPHLVYAENPSQNKPHAECGWEELRWGYERCRQTIKDDFDVIIVHTPHWITRVGHHLLMCPEFKGLSVDPIFPNLFQYNYDLKVDVELSQEILNEIQSAGLIGKPMTNPDFRVDYGSIISCHMLRPQWDKPIIIISSNWAMFDYSNDVGHADMLKLGQATKKAVEKSGKRAILAASTSLSHRHFTVEPETPEDMAFEHTYSHSQYAWDMKLLELMKQGKSQEVLDILPDFIEQTVSECKNGGLSWLLSALDTPNYPGKVHAYGSVIGTGNAIVSWKAGAQ